MASDEPSLSSWMVSAQNGDSDAYVLLLRAVEAMTLNFVRTRVRSPDAAYDVCQDVLMTLHRVRHTYDVTRPFEPWLYSIIRTRLIDYLRRERRITRFEVLTDALPESEGDSNVAASVDLTAILDRLPASQRDAFVMLQLEGLSTEEAARRAGINVPALKVRAHRAYKGLKKLLGGGDYHEPD